MPEEAPVIRIVWPLNVPGGGVGDESVFQESEEGE